MLDKRFALFCVAFLSLCVINLAGCGGAAAIGVAITPSALSVDGTDSVTLTAAVTNDHNAAGVSWTVSGGGALSNSTTTSATYTAPAATSSSQSISVTATSVGDATKTASITLTVPPAPSVTTAGPFNGVVGTAYAVNLAANGGISPYTWTVASGSTLPNGVSLSSSGQITGIPPASAGGTTNVTFNLKDSGTPTALTASRSLSFVIAPAPGLSFVGTMPLAATVNTSFNGSAQASGGAGTLTYSLVSGTLPIGTSLNTSNGAVTGTVTTAGAFTFKIGAADAFGDVASNNYTVTVGYPAMSITTGSLLAAAYVNGNYAQSLAATGGSNNAANYSWSLTGGTSLPVGLSLSSAGAITGRPTGSTGTTGFTVQVMDTVANLSTTQSFSITVNAGVSITTASPLVAGFTGSNYSVSLNAIGGTGTGYTWTVTGGSTLPAGLTLSSAGLLSGKPTATGSNSFNVTVTDSASNIASQTFSITVDAGVSITSSSTLPKGYQGAIYPGATLTATGGSGTGYNWTWAPAGGSSIPSGLVLSSLGTVSGTPTASGTFNIVVTVTDSVSNTTSATVSLAVEAALAISPSTLPSGTQNIAYSQSLTATGGSGTGYTWGSLGNTNPALGITLSAGGLVSGTPTLTGSTTITAQVTDSESHQTSVGLTVTVYNALTITTTILPAGNQGVAYSQSLAAGGGSGSGYTWATTTSNLSSYGLSLSNAGLVSGTPTQSGTASFTAQVTDSSSNTVTQNLSIQVYGALSLPASNSLPAGYTNIAYTGAISGSGGSGTLSITITSALAPSNGTLVTSISSNTVNITGTPSTANTESLTVKLTDTVTNSFITQSYSFVVSTATAPLLTAQTLPDGTVSQVYSSNITAAGGVGPNYAWTVNNTAVPTNGTTVSLGSGMTVSNTGNNVLTVGGTPSASGTVNFSALVKDSTTNLTSSTQNYSVTVNNAGSQISGAVAITNTCGSLSLTPPAFTLSINTTSPQQVQSDNSGSFSFSSIPNGTYTITPSYAGPSGSSAMFYPATANVTVNNGTVNVPTFMVSLGYTVSGTVGYSGPNAGRVYVNLVNNNCGSFGGTGTSLASAGSFTIHGVAPGAYTLQAWMDLASLANEAQNTSDPTGSTPVTVSTANLTGTSVALADPTVTAPAISPKLKSISPTDSGAVISYGGGSVLDSNGLEVSTSYTVQWSTSSSFASTSSATFSAKGSGTNIWIANNSISGISGSFSNSTAYYFRIRGSNSAGNGPWAVWGGGSPQAVTIGVPSGAGYNTVTGSVVIPSSVTPNSGASLYTGYFDQVANIAYATRIGAPNNSPGGNAFTVMVPNGSNYIQFAILDQNNDGLIDAEDVTNVFSNNSSGVSVTGNMSNQNLTVPSVDSVGTVKTQFWQSTSGTGGSTTTSSGYYLNLVVNEQNKLPVAVQLTGASNPNVITPVDVSNVCQGCGGVRYIYNTSIATDVPVVNDTYTFSLTYSDGSTGTAMATVNGVLGSSNLATGLAPTTGSSTSVTPTFTWADPSNASSYSYQFYMSDNSGNTIWQVPGNNSNLSGFSSSITSITWGTDPTGDSANTPSISSLAPSGTTYVWSIQAQDANGNTAQQQVQYQP